MFQNSETREVCMTKTQLEKKIAHLELDNKKIISELIYVDKLMKDIGFIHGLAGLKETAQRINSTFDEED